MAQAIKLGPPESTGTSNPGMAEARMIRGFSSSQGKLLSRIGNAEKGRKWWAWKDSNLRPADYETSRHNGFMLESPRFLRGFLMWILVISEIRAYPETHL